MNVRRIVCLAAALLAVGWLTTSFTSGQEMTLSSQVIERVLPNGLKVLMVKRTDAPLIRCILAYRVGSVNERPGITGISHFHEHMMFKGTSSMGIKPGTLAKDDEYNRQIDALMEQVAAEEAKVKGRDDAKIATLKKQVAELIDKEKKETIVSEEIWGAYQKAGGTGINASTGQEMTQYYVTLPKNKLELYLALEADRLANPVFREFYSERDVITEERRMSENQPGMFFEEQLNATFYAASPYGWDVVGWMSDISRVTKKEMIEYREQFYRPDNATLVLAGDIDPAVVMPLVTKYFGPLKAKGPVAAGPHRGAVARVLPPHDRPELQAALHREAGVRPGVDHAEPHRHVPRSAPLARRPRAALHARPRDERANRARCTSTWSSRDDVATSVMAMASNSMYDGSFQVTATAKEIKNEVEDPPRPAGEAALDLRRGREERTRSTRSCCSA